MFFAVKTPPIMEQDKGGINYGNFHDLGINNIGNRYISGGIRRRWWSDVCCCIWRCDSMCVDLVVPV